MTKKPTRLKNLSVHEVSFVDRGANPGAEILLYKRNSDILNPSEDFNPDVDSSLLKREGVPAMSLEELQKQLKELTELVSKQGNELASVKKENEALQKAKDLFEMESKKPKKEKMDDEKMGDETAKKALEIAKVKEEAIQKEMADLKKSLLVEQGARIALEFAKKAETEFPNLPGTPEQKGQLLKAIDGFESEELKKFALETLKSSDESISKSMTEIGTTKGADKIGAGSAEAKMNKMAEDYAATNKVSIAKAHAELSMTEAYSKEYALYEKEKQAK